MGFGGASAGLASQIEQERAELKRPCAQSERDGEASGARTRACLEGEERGGGVPVRVHDHRHENTTRQRPESRSLQSNNKTLVEGPIRYLQSHTKKKRNRPSSS